MSFVDLIKFGPPKCLKCDKPVFRPGHGAGMFGGSNRGIPGTFVMCMHCQAIWHVRLEGVMVKLRALTPKEAVVLERDMEPFRVSFARQHELADSMGLPYEIYADMMDALLPTKTPDRSKAN